MLAWQETPAPVTCPAYAMHAEPVWAATRPARVDDRHLARVAGGIVRDKRRQRLLGGHAGRQQVEQLRPVGRLGVGLGGDRADARPSPGHDPTDREPVRLDGDAEFAGGGVARDDRVRHAGGPGLEGRP